MGEGCHMLCNREVTDRKYRIHHVSRDYKQTDVIQHGSWIFLSYAHLTRQKIEKFV